MEKIKLVVQTEEQRHAIGVLAARMFVVNLDSRSVINHLSILQ
jgi:hypothetical protein